MILSQVYGARAVTNAREQLCHVISCGKYVNYAYHKLSLARRINQNFVKLFSFYCVIKIKEKKYLEF